MLGQQKGQVWKGTLSLTFTHHTEGKKLLDSVQQNCGICRALYDGLQDELKRSPIKEAGFMALPGLGSVFVANSSFWVIRYILSLMFFTSLSKIYRAADIRMAITASLSVHKSRQEYLYRLDMTLQHERCGEKIEVQRTFFLENPSRSLRNMTISKLTRTQDPKTRSHVRGNRPRRHRRKFSKQPLDGYANATALGRRNEVSTPRVSSASKA